MGGGLKFAKLYGGGVVKENGSRFLAAKRSVCAPGQPPPDRQVPKKER